MCKGMVLVRVKAGGSGDRRVAGTGFDSTLKLLERRPLQLTFEHPWQKEKDSDGTYYYFNSVTEQSQWERPAELGAVVESMREWYGAAAADADETTSRSSRSSSSPTPRGGAISSRLDDTVAGFRYEVRTEFTEAGRLGFEFAPKNKNKRVQVSNVHGGQFSIEESGFPIQES